jgi:hypothetical protein
VDVYYEHDDHEYDCMLQLVELLEYDLKTSEKSGLQDLNLQWYMDDMYEEICEHLYDSDELIDKSLVAL